MLAEEEESNWVIEHLTFVQITQLMQVDQALIIVPANNDDPYLGLMLMHVIVACGIFWNTCLW